MKTKDLMKPIIKCLSPDSTIKEAVNFLKINGDEKRQGSEVLPVVDQAGAIIGILSMHDILKAIHPFYLSMTETNLGNFTWDGMAESLARQAGNKTISVFMTRDVATVREKDSLMDCVNLMIKKNVHQLPVLDDRGRVSGMIYEKDIFYAITEVMLDKEKADKE
ncbi:MAG: CBS domain-containing protein [Deltaproteobacteria bacterium]|nr:CBS domain-containing protein [Deltaproteobacteria bacterium]